MNKNRLKIAHKPGHNLRAWRNFRGGKTKSGQRRRFIAYLLIAPPLKSELSPPEKNNVSPTEKTLAILR